MATNYENIMDTAEIQKLENRFSSIVDRVIRYHPEPDIALIRKAFDFGLKMHAGQVRKSGEPYLTHPLEVLDIIAELKLDTASLVAAILHDTVEDTKTTVDELRDLFGSDVAFLVDGVTKLTKLKFNTREEAQAENIRKMIIAMASDLRVILVKLADRLHNMRTLKHMPEEKQRRIATETMDIYAPMAHRLGISWIKTELEDLSFQYLYPEEYYNIAEQVSLRKRERESLIREVMGYLRDLMNDHKLEAKISGRPKNFWSIFRKMENGKVAFNQIFDILAFRIIVDEPHKCYEALGLVHNLWKPIPGRFKDYIAVPKPNGYQSLHTSVIGPDGERIEVQIRTQEMHKVAEEGVAAHWLYKEGRSVAKNSDTTYAFIHGMMENHLDSSDPFEFMENLKTDLFKDEVYVFTPKGDVIGLPKDATVLDFAYAIHTEVGNTCSGGVIDNRLVTRDHKLQTGDVCKITTSKDQKPKKDWLDFAVTGRARSKIRNIVRDEERAYSREIGLQLLDKELRKRGSAYNSVVKNGELQKYVGGTRYRSQDDLLVDIGYGKVPLTHIVSKLVGENELEKADPEEMPSATTAIKKLFNKLISGDSGVTVEIDGVDNLQVTYASCCKPVPKEKKYKDRKDNKEEVVVDIVGFITRGRGISVHRRGCDKISKLDAARVVDLNWVELKGKSKNRIDFKAELTIKTLDRPGMLAKITAALADSSVDIVKGFSEADEDSNAATHTYVVKTKNESDLRKAHKRLKRIKGVIRVRRKILD